MDDLASRIEEAVSDFGAAVGRNTKQIYAKSADLCTRYNLEPDDFVVAWFAFAGSNSLSELNEENLTKFEKQDLALIKDVKVEPTSIIPATLNIKKESNIKIYGGGRTEVMDIDSDNEEDEVLQMYGIKTEKKSPKKPKPVLRTVAPSNDFSPAGYSPAIESKSVSYNARAKAGESVLRYKCKDSDYWREFGRKERVQVFPKQVTEKIMKSKQVFKYMLQKTSNVSSAVNSAILDMGCEMVEEEDKEMSDLRVPSTEEGWYLGRIRNEEGKLSQAYCYFEGETQLSGGHVVQLDLSQIEEYRLVPGQILMLKGINEMGKVLRVTQLLHPSILPKPKLIPGVCKPLNVILACGPYTPSDSLLYEPLLDLMETVKKEKPDLVILCGPFIDPTHPIIASGDLADTFEDLFDKILKKISSYVPDTTRLVLIPSFKDAHHFPVYPSPKYEINFLKDAPLTFPDPSLFEVSGITFGVTSTDILKHLANSEITKSTITDRMGGLSKLVLSQRNMYPLYPSDESVPFDIQLWKTYCRFSTQTPHVLVMPSDLRYFIKDVEGTIVINPERLTKGKSGGTYARLQINMGDSKERVTSVADFCCGEIMKI